MIPGPADVPTIPETIPGPSDAGIPRAPTNDSWPIRGTDGDSPAAVTTGRAEAAVRGGHKSFSVPPAAEELVLFPATRSPGPISDSDRSFNLFLTERDFSANWIAVNNSSAGTF
jgi:hypothetical protein